ncbi:hypothetical protein D3C87_1740370 [compost metagenome]
MVYSAADLKPDDGEYVDRPSRLRAACDEVTPNQVCMASWLAHSVLTPTCTVFCSVMSAA